MLLNKFDKTLEFNETKKEYDYSILTHRSTLKKNNFI